MSAGGALPLHRNRQRADSFGDDAEKYDRVRPTYPEQLIDELMLDTPRSVLDVGCGTGITTRLFMRRGCTVLGIEPDARMAAVARRQGATVEDGAFEGWDPRDRRFDLLVAGQAWHWVEPDAGARKAAEVLAPGGRIGLFWNQSFPTGETRRVMDDVYQRVAPALGTTSVLLGERHGSLYKDIAQSLRDAGHFADVRLVDYRREVQYSTEQWLELASTHSDHHTLPADELDALIRELRTALDAIGGQIPVRYETTLVTGQILSG